MVVRIENNTICRDDILRANFFAFDKIKELLVFVIFTIKLLYYISQIFLKFQEFIHVRLCNFLVKKHKLNL